LSLVKTSDVQCEGYNYSYEILYRPVRSAFYVRCTGSLTFAHFCCLYVIMSSLSPLLRTNEKRNEELSPAQKELCAVIFLMLLAGFAPLSPLYKTLPSSNYTGLLFRVLRPDESPHLGLIAKNPLATKKKAGHVSSGSRENFRSQFISFTRNFWLAMYFACGIENGRVVGLLLNLGMEPGMECQTDSLTNLAAWNHAWNGGRGKWDSNPRPGPNGWSLFHCAA
jgi:hypothetical protein